MMNNTTLNSNSTGNGTDEYYFWFDWPPVVDISAYIFFELVYMIFIVAVGTPGNLLIVIVQAKNPKKSTTDYYVMVMAAYEFVCSSFNTPMSALRNHNLLWKYFGSTFMCNLVSFSHNFTLIVSAIHLTAIAVDRCIQTCLPLNQFYNVTVAKKACVGMFILGVALSWPYGIMFYWEEFFLLCFQFFPLPLLNIEGRTWGIIGTFFGAILFFVMLASYIAITVALRRRHNKKKMAAKLKYRPRSDQADQITMTPAANADTDSGMPDTSFSAIDEEPTAMSKSEVDVDASDSMPAVSDGSLRTFASTDAIQPEYTSNQTDAPNKEQATKTSSKQKVKKSAAAKNLNTEGKNLTKLTVIMFLITLVYMGTYIINWLLYMLGPDAFGPGFFTISFSIPLINCTTNPILFFTMSSRFRANARKILCGRK